MIFCHFWIPSESVSRMFAQFEGRLFGLVVLDPLRHKIADLVIEIDTLCLSQCITRFLGMSLLVEIFSAKLPRKVSASLPQPPREEETLRGEGAVLNFDNPSVVCAFLLFFVCDENSLKIPVNVASTEWVEYPYVKKCFLATLPESSCCNIKASFILSVPSIHFSSVQM